MSHAKILRVFFSIDATLGPRFSARFAFAKPKPVLLTRLAAASHHVVVTEELPSRLVFKAQQRRHAIPSSMLDQAGDEITAVIGTQTFTTQSRSVARARTRAIVLRTFTGYAYTGPRSAASHSDRGLYHAFFSAADAVRSPQGLARAIQKTERPPNSSRLCRPLVRPAKPQVRSAVSRICTGRWRRLLS